MLVLSAEVFQLALKLRVPTMFFRTSMKRNVWIIIIQIWFLNILKVSTCDMLVVPDNSFDIQLEITVGVTVDLSLC